MGTEYETAAFHWSLVLINTHLLSVVTRRSSSTMNGNISAMGCVLPNYCKITDVTSIQMNNKNFFAVIECFLHTVCLKTTNG